MFHPKHKRALLTLRRYRPSRRTKGGDNPEASGERLVLRGGSPLFTFADPLLLRRPIKLDVSKESHPSSFVINSIVMHQHTALRSSKNYCSPIGHGDVEISFCFFRQIWIKMTGTSPKLPDEGTFCEAAGTKAKPERPTHAHANAHARREREDQISFYGVWDRIFYSQHISPCLVAYAALSCLDESLTQSFPRQGSISMTSNVLTSRHTRQEYWSDGYESFYFVRNATPRAQHSTARAWRLAKNFGACCQLMVVISTSFIFPSRPRPWKISCVLVDLLKDAEISRTAFHRVLLEQASVFEISISFDLLAARIRLSIS